MRLVIHFCLLWSAVVIGRAAAAPAAAPAPAAGPEVLFTFDDGPDLARTPKVLDALAAHHVHAVFFVNGRHFMGRTPGAERARALLRDVLGRGHLIGNHTVHHTRLCGRRVKRLPVEEVTANITLIEQATGVRPTLFRAPYGANCPALREFLAGIGLHHTGWDIDPQDWRIRNATRVRERVIAQLKRLRGRAVILLHDIQADTVKALPQILDWIDRENQVRVGRGEPPIRIIDSSTLLAQHPSTPSVVGHLASP